MNINYALRSTIRNVFNTYPGRFMSAADIRVAMRNQPTPQNYTVHQIAASILQFINSVHNDYEKKYDADRKVNLYRIEI
jgi:hypothetical protein